MIQPNKFEDLNDQFTSLGVGITQSNKFRDRWRTLLYSFSQKKKPNLIVANQPDDTDCLNLTKQATQPGHSGWVTRKTTVVFFLWKSVVVINKS